jgi:hypothetical protein
MLLNPEENQMKKIIIAAALAAAIATGCGGTSHAGQVKACKAAMKADFAKGMTNPGASPATEPEQCKGLDAATLKRLAGQIIGGALSGTGTAGGAAGFLSGFRAAGFGTRDVRGATDVQLLKVGHVICQGFGSGMNYSDQVLAFSESDAQPTTAQVTSLVSLAVHDLCPQYATALPAGTP